MDAVRNRSRIIVVATPRGRVEILRQEMTGIRRSSGWTWFWVARRVGQKDWQEASTAREAIRRATLLSPRQSAAWLTDAATTAERELLTTPSSDTTVPAS